MPQISDISRQLATVRRMIEKEQNELKLRRLVEIEAILLLELDSALIAA